MQRLLTRLKGLARLFLIGLPQLLVATFQGRNTRWWRYELHRLALGRGLLLENVLDVNESTHPKRALLSYIVLPFLLDPDSPKLLKHGNRWRSRQLAQMLNELGYVVDVVDHDDQRTKIPDRYDLLLGLGRAHALAQNWGDRTRKVFLATAPDPKLQHSWLRARLAEVNAKRGCAIPGYRQGADYPPEGLRHFDALACLGDADNAERFRRYFKGPVYPWNNHAWDRFIGAPEGKDFDEARRRFLFFGTRDQILCGLDLALAVFAERPDLELYVCGPFEKEPEFVDCFRNELYENPNIHALGWIELGGARFEELTKRCGFVIAPMCPTSCHGSLVICAGAGLVPLATAQAAGVDTDRLETTIRSLDPAQVGVVVDQASQRSADWLRSASSELVETVRRDFSQAAFSHRFRKILQDVVKD